MRGARLAAKAALDACCLALVAPCAAACAIERRIDPQAEGVFAFWAHTFALAPGLPGAFIRRAFYRLTLTRCARAFFVGFGSMFSHRWTIVEEGVYVGAYTIVGASKLRRGCLVGSRSSIVSGSDLHVLDTNGRWTPSDLTRLRQVEVGENALIGEACTVLADVGASAMVAAGSVVASRVPSGILVAGNPARFVRRLTIDVAQRDEDSRELEKRVSVR